MFALYSAWYFWIPKILGLDYNRSWGKVHFWILFIGVNVTFFPQHFLGLQGMPRRISDYPDSFAGWNLISSFGSLISVIATWLFLHVVYVQLTMGISTFRYPWLTPQFHSDMLRALLERSFESLEWGLNSPPKPHSFVSLPVQSGIGDLIAIYESMHTSIMYGIDCFDYGVSTAFVNIGNQLNNACVSTQAACSKSVMSFDIAVSSGCAAFIEKASAANLGAYNVASSVVTTPWPAAVYNAAKNTVVNSVILNLVHYFPYIVNEYIYTIPSGNYNIGNNLFKISLLVSPPRPPIDADGQAITSLAYSLTLNILNGNFLIFSEQVFRPLMGTILFAQYNSNAVAANPLLFPSHTVFCHVYPVLLITGCCFIRYFTPVVWSFIN